jgi:putative acetyltransferase
MAAQIQITPVRPDSPEVRALIEALDAYQSALYPAESNHFVPIHELCRTEATFLAARLGDLTIGCGALVDRGDYGEIKRMYVDPSARGLGIGRKLLLAVEHAARDKGIEVLRLETGVSQPEALALYEKAGYVRRGPFGDYAEDPLSVFMEKALTVRS